MFTFPNGPPKRFAQGIWALLTVAATAAWFGFHPAPAAYALLAVLLTAASLEAALAFCLGCWLFSRLRARGDDPRLGRRLPHGHQPPPTPRGRLGAPSRTRAGVAGAGLVRSPGSFGP
ncbi:MAG: DUF4395 family protein [Candidatus Dormibacteraeota bacterium]|nr:DUF4395 family protein [Candidatus Dormibacteraeota bacterium]